MGSLQSRITTPIPRAFPAREVQLGVHRQLFWSYIPKRVVVGYNNSGRLNLFIIVDIHLYILQNN